MIIVKDVTYEVLEQLTEDEIYELASKCFDLLGRLERLKYTRQKQARSGMGAYKNGGND